MRLNADWRVSPPFPQLLLPLWVFVLSCRSSRGEEIGVLQGQVTWLLAFPPLPSSEIPGDVDWVERCLSWSIGKEPWGWQELWSSPCPREPGLLSREGTWSITETSCTWNMGRNATECEDLGLYLGSTMCSMRAKGCRGWLGEVSGSGSFQGWIWSFSGKSMTVSLQEVHLSVWGLSAGLQPQWHLSIRSHHSRIYGRAPLAMSDQHAAFLS